MVIEPIRYIGINLGPEVGSDDLLVGVRVVPDGRNENTVLGRTLNHDEPDSGEGIVYQPGEQVVFPPRSIHVTIQDVDRKNTPGAYGYAAIANTIWTWSHIPPPPNLNLFHYLFAVARRLDSAYSLCISALSRADDHSGDTFTELRARLFRALGDAELMCIALNRAESMINDISTRFGVATPVPQIVSAILPSLRAIRDAFEHIDERAMGHARREQRTDALSIFNQAGFPISGILRYANHSLDLRTQVIPALVAARKFIFDVAAEKAGAAKTNTEPIVFGPLGPPEK